MTMTVLVVAEFPVMPFAGLCGQLVPVGESSEVELWR